MAILKSGKCVIAGIGGATGAGICQAFVREGWQVRAFVLPEAGDKGLFPDSFHGSANLDVMDTSSADDVLNQAAHLLESGFTADLLVYCVDLFDDYAALDMGRDMSLNAELDYVEIETVYNRAALGMLRCVQAFLPVMQDGALKRICSFTHADALLNGSKAQGGFAANMASAAINSGMAILFNRLNPLGYSFRVFCENPEAPSAARAAYEYFVRDRSLEADNPRHSDERRFVARDGAGREHAW